MRLALALVVVAFCSSSAEASGPIRRWVAEHRPGILFKKKSAGCAKAAPAVAAAPCTSCTPPCPCPAGACPTKCPVAVLGFQLQAPAQRCADGTCPLRR